MYRPSTLKGIALNMTFRITDCLDLHNAIFILLYYTK